MEAEGRVLRTSPDVPFVFASLEARHTIATAGLGRDSKADDVKKTLRKCMFFKAKGSKTSQQPPLLQCHCCLKTFLISSEHFLQGNKSLVGHFAPASTGRSCSLHWMYRLGTVAQWHWRSETCSKRSLSNAFWATRLVEPFKLFPVSYSFQCFASSVCLQAYAVDTSYGA